MRTATTGRILGVVLLITLGHMALTSWALRLVVPPENISLMWLPDGFLLGSLVALRDRRRWPAVLALVALSTVTLETNTTGRPLALTAVFLLANLAQSTVGAWVMQRLAGGPRGFTEFGQLATFLGVCVLGLPALSAGLATAGMLEYGLAADPWNVYRTWLGSAAMGILFVAPLVLYGSQYALRRAPRASPGSALEHVALILVACGVAGLSSVGAPWMSGPFGVGLLLGLPLLVWSAIRRGVWGAVTVSATLVVAQLHLIAFGLTEGVVGGAPLSQSVLHLQTYFASAVVASLFTGLAVEKYARAATESEDERRRYSAMFDHAPVSLWEEDFSEVKAYLDQHVQGDISAYLSAHPETVAECAKRVRVLAINAKSLELFGARSEQQMLESIQQVFNDDSLRAFEREIVTFYEGAGTFQTQAQQRTLQGEVLETSTNVRIAPGAEQDWRRVLVAIEDLTALRRQDAALRRAHKMDALGKMVGGIAHDFNNILGVVLGGLELLDDEPKLDSEVRTQLHAIRRAGLRAKVLTQQLLNFSRARATELTVLDVGRTVRSVDDLVRRALTPAIDVRHELSRALWKVEVDGGDLEDALLNLAINARDAMPDGGTLTFSTQNRAISADEVEGLPGGDYVELGVTDTGTGMSEAVQERLFEPFFTTKPKGKGTGLGLATVYGFVQRSSGHIEVRSSPGEGARFTLLLPRAAQDTTPIDPLPAPRAELPRGQGTILVVDDEAQLRHLAKRLLVRLGYDVLSARDGVEALATLEAHPEIDLLFSDVVMPAGVDGYELAERARTLCPHLCVLLTSGYSPQSGEHPTRDAFPLLAKPYRLADLAHQVRALLEPNADEATAIRRAEWSDDLSVGVEAIDEDHRHLFEVLDQAIAKVTRRAAVAPMVDELAQCARDHFAREETLMDQAGYPASPAHRASHQSLLARLEREHGRLAQGEVSAGEFTEFLHQWITEHLEGEDRALARYLRSQR